MPVSSIPSAFGTFSRLPKELRILIWKELLPESRPLGSYLWPKESLAILRTSQQLNAEISIELYNRRILTFHIAPNPLPCSDPLSNQPSTIAVSDQFGSEWRLYPRFQTPWDKLDYSSFVWRHLPFHRLNSVKFELEAPDADDPAQLIVMWNKLTWLMDLVQHAGGFAKVEVHALQTVQDWCADGELRQTFTDELPTIIEDRDTTDLEIMLSPFLRLRNVKSIEVHHPFDKEHKTLDELTSNILHKTHSTTSFGLDITETDHTDDEMIISYEDTWAVYFENILDDLPGPSAPFVRLERFWNWTPQYTKNIWCLIDAECEIGGALLTELERRAGIGALARRITAMMAFNPMSLEHVQEEESGDSGEAWYSEKEDSPENVVLSSGKDGWVPGKWWKYQQGIPRQSSAEHEEHIQKYGYRERIPVFNTGDNWRLHRNW